MLPDKDKYTYNNDFILPLAYQPEGVHAVATIVAPLTEKDIDRIIEMAWEDRTPFDAIEYQFGLNESDVRKLMKQQLKFRAYTVWRTRVEACKTKHQKTRLAGISRFKCDRQRAISDNRISKRR